MYIYNLNTINLLDERMDDSGVDSIRSFFYQLAKANEKEALNLINDENLHFTSLFVLKHEIEELKLLRILSGKECKLIDEFKRLDKNTQKLLSESSVMLHHNNICKWQEWLECPIEEQIKFARIGGIR